MVNTILTSLLIILIGFSSSISFAEEDYVPDWLKDTAGFWAENKISDQDFLQSLQYLIDNDFLLIPHDKNLTFEPDRDLKINLHTSKQEYRAGDDVVIFGTVSQLIDDQKISIVISSTKGDFISVVKITPSIDGSYAFVAKDSSFKEHGEYIVNVYYAGQVHKQTSYSFTPIN